MGHLGGEGFEGWSRVPGLEGEDPAREHGHGFEFGAMAFAVEVLEFVDEGGEDRPFPGVDGGLGRWVDCG